MESLLPDSVVAGSEEGWKESKNPVCIQVKRKYVLTVGNKIAIVSRHWPSYVVAAKYLP